MPVIIPVDLPATETLKQEFIPVMHEERARTQDIRPLHIGLLNLMPKKIATETQFLRLIGNTRNGSALHAALCAQKLRAGARRTPLRPGRRPLLQRLHSERPHL